MRSVWTAKMNTSQFAPSSAADSAIGSAPRALRSARASSCERRKSSSSAIPNAAEHSARQAVSSAAGIGASCFQ